MVPFIALLVPPADQKLSSQALHLLCQLLQTRRHMRGNLLKNKLTSKRPVAFVALDCLTWPLFLLTPKLGRG